MALHRPRLAPNAVVNALQHRGRRWTRGSEALPWPAPPPRTLVEPVSAKVLRARIRQYAESCLPDLFTWTNFDIAWSQRHAVATCCRILYTLQTGQVASKKASMIWAIGHLDPTWESLIRQSLWDRVLGWDPDEPPRAGSVDATLSFAEYAKRLAATSNDDGIDPRAIR